MAGNSIMAGIPAGPIQFGIPTRTPAEIQAGVPAGTPRDFYPHEQRRMRMLSVRFLDDEPMIGPPSFRGKDLEKPRLRRCIFDPDTIVFESRLGGGLDGYVWKVWFGKEGPFALKVFWDQEPPQKLFSYYALQRECQNAALLQLMQASLASGPVLVHDMPKDGDDAMDNFFSFSVEDHRVREKEGISADNFPEGTKFISSMPRMAKCYGWLKLNSSLWDRLPGRLQAPRQKIEKTERYVEENKDYVSVVYELIEDGENVPSIVEEVDDFLWHAGFSYTWIPLARNWKNSVLVDHADIVHRRGFGWKEKSYMKREAKDILLE